MYIFDQINVQACYVFNVVSVANSKYLKGKCFQTIGNPGRYCRQMTRMMTASPVPKRPCSILKVLNPGKIFHVARNPFAVYYLLGIYVHASLTPDLTNTVKKAILLYV